MDGWRARLPSPKVAAHAVLPMQAEEEDVPTTSPRRHWLREASASYDFRIDVWRLEKLPSEVLPGVLGEVTITTKDGHHVQLVDVDLTNVDQDSRPYEPQIVSADFDFDGQEDFAVHDGFAGSYGGPSYGIYLFAGAAEGFVRSESLSALTEEGSGLFDVDPTHKRLRVHSKSGCCIHGSTDYTITNGQPIMVRRESRNAVDGCRIDVQVPGADGTLVHTTRSCPEAQVP